jgi:hypothetical protein
VRTRLGESGQAQKLEEVATELGSAMATMTAAKERHQATGAVLQAALDDVEAASPEEVAAAIMALQTRPPGELPDHLDPLAPVYRELPLSWLSLPEGDASRRRALRGI